MTEPELPPTAGIRRPRSGSRWAGSSVAVGRIAPDVLEDGGRDAPLTPRGRILFWGTIVVLVLAVSILFVITLAER